MAKDSLANWGISHGIYITGTNTPFDFSFWHITRYFIYQFKEIGGSIF